MSGIICPKCESTDTVVALADQACLICHNCGCQWENPDLDFGVPSDLSLPDPQLARFDQDQTYANRQQVDRSKIIHGDRLRKFLESRARTVWARVAGNTEVCPQAFITGLMAGWVDLARCQRDGMSQAAQEITRELN